MIMDIPKQWKEILVKNEELMRIFQEQKEMDHYGDEPVPPYFFHYFRPDRYEAMKGFFIDFENGIEMYEYIKEIFEATKNNYKHGDSVSAYFVPQKQDVSKEKLFEIASEYISQLNWILNENAEETYDFEKMDIKELTEKEFREQYDYENIDECDLHCIKGDWIIDMLPDIENNPLSMFSEALYQMACDYDISYYISWPLVGRKDCINPFIAYVQLWKLGYRPWVVDKSMIVMTK